MAANKEGKPKRNRTTFATDLVLVEETLNKDPFSAEKPGDSWHLVATNLEATQKFKAAVTVRYCQERVNALLVIHDKNDIANLKRSGTEEEFGQFQQMLGELSVFRKISQRNIQDAKKAKAKKQEESDQIELEVQTAGDRTFARSIAGSSNSDDWEADNINSEEEQRRKEESPEYVRRKRKTASAGKAHKTGRKDLSESDMASVFAKQDQLTFEHRKMELQQQKELKEMELYEKELDSRDLNAKLQHNFRLMELDLKLEHLALRKRELDLLEQR